ncbi:2-phospho-L-lactate transferase CofD family protein [Actinomadura sp. NEAU-AAG7]|uniref:gluconeogenesis factor YvcK family protein n=1 Tax=Actinomadura sp. NEAU-AAG7 TaxID=2839640 RepID=UPI0035AE689C
MTSAASETPAGEPVREPARVADGERNGTVKPLGPKVVALGGGHGLYASLSALRRVTDRLTAVVTVADDGGSSGRLRRELGVLPPGDLRMALAALCGDDEWGQTWRDVVQHRFRSEGDLQGHAVGNLLIVALWELLGGASTGAAADLLLGALPGGAAGAPSGTAPQGAPGGAPNSAPTSAPTSAHGGLAEGPSSGEAGDSPGGSPGGVPGAVAGGPRGGEPAGAGVPGGPAWGAPSGSTVAGLDWVGRLLGAHGRVLPMAAVPMDIVAEVRGADPSRPDEVTRVKGQVACAKTPGSVLGVSLVPADPPACPEALAAVEDADWIVFGPGSWFTSVLPHLKVPALARALTSSRARRVVALNLAPQPGETDDFSPQAHLEVLQAHAPDLSVDVVIADEGVVEDPGALEKAVRRLGGRLVLAGVAADDGSPRHDPARLAQAFVQIFSE